MKNVTGIVIGVILIALVAWLVISAAKNDENVDEQNAMGQLYIGVTDATADISNVTDIDMEVEKVEIYSQAEGWMTVSSNSKTYSLLELKASGKTELYASEEVEARIYDRIRVTLGDVNVRTKTNGTIEAAKPNSQMVINGRMNVKAGESTHVKLDFLADKSLHMTSDNKYVFAPFVSTESRSSAVVSVSSENVVTVAGGIVDSTLNVGMDLSGTSRTNFQLTTDNTLKVESSLGGSASFILNGKTYTKAEDAEDTKNDSDVEGGAGGSIDIEVDANGVLK